MRFSEAWLREWVDPPVDSQTLADQFTMAGLEVDALETAAPAFSGVVVGLVTVREQHPDADKLGVCQVDVAAGESLQIVCGASNVAAGMKVPVALVGALLPGELKIKAAKLRGVASAGMICSAKELGLAESSEGIMPLPADAPLGADLRDYLALDDQIIELDLTPDRGDCLGLRGLALEVSALNRVEVRLPDMSPLTPACEQRMAVELSAEQACPRYSCRVIRGVNARAETPLWMRERLRRSGLRSIDPIVDVTNYVLIELGQPLHAFDLAKIQGPIQVRMAAVGERLRLLDGKEITLTPDNLVIADGKGPLALAGIMGGADSGVSAETQDILLESAHFSPRALAGKARGLGLHTDSSHRFERGVDPSLQVQALERASRLLLEIAGGEPGPVVDLARPGLTQRQPIALRRQRIGRLLGIEIDDASVVDGLQRLGMQVQPWDQGWQVTPPPSRFDIAIEVDLIEEVGRIYGFENIPSATPRVPMNLCLRPERAFDLEQARERLAALGYQEVITYSFIDAAKAKALLPEFEPIALANPLSAELSVMRTSLWPGLLATARHNLARQQGRVRIFESGLQFRQLANGMDQRPMLAALTYGDITEEQWGQPGREADFYDIKADYEALLALLGPGLEARFEAVEHPALHPGQSARVMLGERLIGHLGMLHPRLSQVFDLTGNTFLLELDLSAAGQGALPKFSPLTRFPWIRRDLALVVEREVDYGSLKACIREYADENLQDIILFDVYTGQRIDSSRKSLALGLILQDSSRTLTDQEVDDSVARIVQGLADKLGARLRD
ncbi:MAG: phenylalanine--tRNA ligase subunit beta [Gammaproteobacteria bacterium SHHR-1]|uniref:phenylalanine--tRNA ligase subunit beta n=1 Tax=Magnetovirga frankeli TaxID=947516 RepID=UPI001292D61C|nr:phenylalanine--tRNA ligase subunit beta [gamma proteobacterium SS-5]